jgi:transposase
MAERVAVRDITNEEGNKLLSIVRRGSGSVVRWRRAQIVLWSAQRMDVPAIAKIAFTSEDRVREVIHNFNADGFDSLAAKYSGGRPPKFTLPERREIKKIALSRPVDHNLPFSTWSLSKLAEFLVAEGVVDDISHEGLRVLLREEGVSFQVIKTYKQSNDPDFEAKKNRVLELYEIADGKAKPKKGDPTSSSAWTSSGRSTSCPGPGKQWAPRIVKGEESNQEPRRRRRRATYTRTKGVRHLMAAYDLNTDKMYGHVKVHQGPHQVPRVLPLPAHPLPAERPHRHRAGQLQPAPLDQKRLAGGRLGRGQQRGAGLRADQRQLAEPDRGAVPGAALLHPRRHRSPLTRRAELDDPPLHHLAQPQRSRQNAA